MKYLIGIDLGTSATKTVLFDDKGNKIASSTVEYELIQPKIVGQSKIQMIGGTLLL